MLRGQFTYTATSGPGAWDSAPGWKVHSALGVPGLPGVPEEVVRRAARTVGGFVPPALPELASRADVEALPRCLRLDAVAEDLVSVTQIVAAGPDYSGRPNFFAHGLLVEIGDDEADDHGFIRPADLWRASVWLHPLGAQEVETAEPDPSLGYLPRGALDDAALEEFMRRRPNQRDFVLSAFERYTHGAGPLVIVGDDAESAVQWMRLIGSLVLPATAWRLPFSTYERIQDVESPAQWPFAVVGVPTSDAATAARLPGARFAVLSDDDGPVRAGADRWVLPDRTELGAGPWARLAESAVLTDLLPAVRRQLDALAIEVGSSTVDRPLWALPAAFLLLEEELPFEELAGDAAQLVLAHWPPRLTAGKRTVERLLRQLRAQVGAATVAETLGSRGGQPLDGVVAQLALAEPIREAFASREAYLQLGGRLPTRLPGLQPSVRAELDETFWAALDWLPGAGELAPRVLLHLASFVDGSGPLALRITELGVDLLVPRLLDPDIDPVTLRWPPLTPWLWDALRVRLAVELDGGPHLPGQAFSPRTHAWLAPLPAPRGELQPAALEALGPVERERHAHAHYSRAPSTPLERAGAFLAVIHNKAMNERRPEASRAWRAYDEVYRRTPLTLAEAVVLMQHLPADIAFADVLLDVLDRQSGNRDAMPAIEMLRARERLLPVQEQKLARYEASAGQVLIDDPNALTSLFVDARLAQGAPGAWVPAGEAVLRLDATRLPLHGLPTQLDDPAFPWDEALQLLASRHPYPDDRLIVAANLIVRGARAQVFPQDDQAARWLTGKVGSGNARRYHLAARQLIGGDDAIDRLLPSVEELALRVRRRISPPGSRRDDEHDPDVEWRERAISAAATLSRRPASPRNDEPPAAAKRRRWGL